MTWHLYFIFSKTIRHEPNDRYQNASEALADATLVRNRIQAKLLPLEILAQQTCPICGVGKFEQATDYHRRDDQEIMNQLNQLHNPPSYAVCPYCGFVALFLGTLQQRNLDGRKKLQSRHTSSSTGSLCLVGRDCRMGQIAWRYGCRRVCPGLASEAIC